MNNSFEKNNFRELIVSNPERQKEIARMGGIRSGAVRREKARREKAYQLMLDVAWEMPMPLERKPRKRRRINKKRKNVP